jgi:putative membrane protein
MPSQLQSPEVSAFATAIFFILRDAGLTVLLLLVGVVFYGFFSPHKDIEHIREGNTAAALSYGSVVLGLAIPLAAQMAPSTSPVDIIIYGVAAISIQLLVFRLVIDILLLRGLPQRVQEGDIGAAVVLAAAKLSTALIFAAALAG